MAASAVKPSSTLEALAEKIAEKGRSLSEEQREAARETFQKIVDRAKAKAVRASAAGKRETA